MNSRGTSPNTCEGERAASAPCCAQRSQRVGFQNAPAALRLPLAGIAARLRRLQRLHGDERGTISILSVFCLLMFTMILVMVTNVARHVDDKLKMQNAADASAYSGGVVMARGMNTIAFTNHLLADVFAMTAFLREGRDRNAESLTPEILDAWEEIGPVFSKAEFQKFKRLGAAITDKVPKERELVNSFGEMTAAASELTLPVFEYTLAEEVIPRFQRTVVRTIPRLSAQTANEVARRHGFSAAERQRSRARSGSQSGFSGSPSGVGSGSPRMTGTDAQRGRMMAVTWVVRLRYPGESRSGPRMRPLPVIDPAPFALNSGTGTQGGSGAPLNDWAELPASQRNYYLQTALEQRRELAHFYLDRWNEDRLVVFEHDAKMSSYFPLWRIATCGQLAKLLTVDYPLSNLPMQIRLRERHIEALQASELAADGQEKLTINQVLRKDPDLNQFLEWEYQSLTIVYRRPMEEMGPGLFKNPLTRESDAMAFAQVELFLPQPRRSRGYRGGGGGSGQEVVNLGGTYGTPDLGQIARNNPGQPPDANRSPCEEVWVRDNWPRHWDLLNQHWMVKLVPARAEALPRLLQQEPRSPTTRAMFTELQLRTPDLGGADIRDLSQINKH